MKRLYVSNYAFFSLLIAQIAVISDIIQSIFDINFPILRYLLYFISAYCLIKAVQKNSFKFSLLIQKNKFLVLFLFWIILLIIMSIPQLLDGYINHIKLKQFLSGLGYIYLLSFFAILKPNLLFYRSFFKFSFILATVYLVITIPLFSYFTISSNNHGEGYGSVFAAGASIVLLTFSYHSKRVNMISVAAVLLALIVNMLLARRNQVLYFSSVLFFSYCIHIFHQSNYMRKSKLRTIMSSSFFILLLSLVFYVNIDQFSLFFERANTGMESREHIFDLFFDDFNSHPKDWIWGRGVFGEFQGGILASDDNTGLREGIENGYLNLILKGGWIYLGLLIIISIKAVYNGFLKSKNLLCKAFACIILIYFIDMIGFGLSSATLRYVIVFIAIGGCYSNELLQCSDEYLSKKIGLKQ